MQFDFGQNWAEFSGHALDAEKVHQARDHFHDLMAGITLRESSFLDIGFGQGLSLLSAVEAEARAVGCDINPKCAVVLERNGRFFPDTVSREIPVVVGSILDNRVVRRLCTLAPSREGGYDIVHSWGVLHHTGKMKEGIRHAASLVRPGGNLVLAIYDRHWSSPLWLRLKKVYCRASPPFQHAMTLAFWPVIFVAKALVTGKNPLTMIRGMDFHYNLVDWLGGFPYEYASVQEIEKMVSGLGFEHIRSIPSPVPTGCNEFIFKRYA